MEFKVDDNALAMLDTLTIESNATELIDWAQGIQGKYSAIIVTDDTAATAKKIRAEINKAQKAINDERIRVKKRYLAPYQTWEKRIKVATAVLEDTSDKLDKQLKAMEEQRKAEKRNELIRTFDENIGSAKDYIVFTDIEDTKWLNATVKLETAKQELVDSCAAWAKCIDDFEAAIKDEQETVKLALRREMKQTHSPMTVFTLLKQMHDAQLKEQTEKEKEPVTEQEKSPVQEKTAFFGGELEEPVFPVRLEMRMKPSQARQLKSILDDWEVEYSILQEI